MDKLSEAEIPLVAVLLATHKPTNFIEEQIESIKAQVGVNIRIYWGDYGSSVESKNFVRGLLGGLDFTEHAILEPGYASNFLELLSKTSEQYIAFSDQDDVWLPTKLQNQVVSLQEYHEQPSMTHSNPEILSGIERKVKASRCQNHDFSSLAFTNCSQGCTMMINSAARDKVLRSLPEGIVWHDWWIGLVISLTGKIYFSKEIEVLYRIHEGNAIGLPGWRKRIKEYIKRPPGQVSYQIEQAVLRFGSKNSIELREYSQIQDLCSEKFGIRLWANVIDTRRRAKFWEDKLRRVLWTLKRP